MNQILIRITLTIVGVLANFAFFLIIAREFFTSLRKFFSEKTPAQKSSYRRSVIYNGIGCLVFLLGIYYALTAPNYSITTLVLVGVIFILFFFGSRFFG